MIYPSLIQISRDLRKNQTPHEKKLWRLLRNRRFQGFKFHRQFVLDPYVVDFCCYERRLVIELDGGGHNNPIQENDDQKRDTHLCKKGFTVLRFWNHELDKNEAGVLDKIFQQLNTPLIRPHGHLLPKEKEERIPPTEKPEAP